MKFRMDQLLRSLSIGLDAVENELTGCTTNHGKRVAVLTAAMGRYLGWDENQIIGVVACSLLHDNALTESFVENHIQPGEMNLLISHCLKGEVNVTLLPFTTDVTGFITYHHERADGSGPMGLLAEETPVGAQLIAIADRFDIVYNIKNQPASVLPTLRNIIVKERGICNTRIATDAMFGILDDSLLLSLKDDRIDHSYAHTIPEWNVDLQAESMMEIADFVASITDYKSIFTAKHSIQIARRAFWMSRFYGFDMEISAQIYLAAALHDVGKLVTPITILEKPGKLDREEFEIIKKHVYWSYIMLKDIEGFDNICRWAVTHHRKLNGVGYPDLPAEYLNMDFISRMMACIDIYQAVRETRPYHSGRTHKETMDIMWKMVSNGEIDSRITQDLDNEMSRFLHEEGDLPLPVIQDDDFVNKDSLVHEIITIH